MEYSLSWGNELYLVHLCKSWKWVRPSDMPDMFEVGKNGSGTEIKIINIMLTVSSYCYPVYILSSSSHTGYICPGDT